MLRSDYTMQRTTFMHRVTLALACAFCFVSASPAADAAKPVWDLAALSVPPATFPSETIKSSTPEIRALFFEGRPFHGKPTRVFAWMGVPRGEPGQKFPGMVLVHGGGGTAFESWVKLWVDRGYAAIAMDTCGALPKPDAAPRPRHEFSGPPGWGGFDQIDQSAEDQWTYHAVADAVLAHSLLRAQPEVDADRIGLTGISWGGYLTCIIAGVDSRLRFAVPVYGCGFYRDTVFAAPVNQSGTDGGNRWMEWWDPSNYLPRAKMPMLWVNGSNDFAYWFPAMQKSYRIIPAENRTLSVRLRMPHGHGPAGESPKEIAVFADSILRGGKPLPRVVSQQIQDRQVTVAFESTVPVVKAELNFTSDTTSPWPDRPWTAIPATLQGNVATATLPAEAKLYYMNLFDDRDCAVSSEHAER
jgi:dienelactone hydrolase